MTASETKAAPWQLSTVAAWLPIACCYLYLLLYGGTAHALLHAWPYAIVRILIIAIILYCASVLLRRHLPVESLGGGVDWALIALGVTAGASTATASDALRSWENLGLLGAYGLLLYMAVNWCRWQRSVHPLAVLLGIGNVLLCICARIMPIVAPWLGKDPSLNLAGYLVYPLGNWNLTGSYLVLTTPLLVGLALRPGSRLQLAWWGAVAFALMSILQSGSRIAVLVAVGEAIFAIGAFFLRRRRMIGRTALIMLVLAGLVGSVYDGNTIWTRLAPLSDTGVDVVAGRVLSDESAAQRLDIWRGAWASWHWFGNGLDSVAVQFSQDMLQSPRFATFSTANLHNTYLNLLYELGLPGITATLLVFALIVAAGLVAAKNAGADAPLVWGALWGLGGYGFCLFVLFHAQIPVMLVTAIFVAAIVLAYGQGQVLTQLRPFLALNVCLSLLVIGVPFTMASYAFWHYTRCIELWNVERQPALEHLREGVIYNPLELFPRLALGLALAEQPSRADREEGLQQLQWVNDRSALPIGRLMAGTIALQLGEPARAVTDLEMATRLRYYSGLYHLKLAEAYLASNREAAAVSTMSRALVFSPILMDAAIWHQPEWQRLRPAVMDRAVLSAAAQLTTRPRSAAMNYRLGRLLLGAGKTTEARAELLEALGKADIPDADQRPTLVRRIQFALGMAYAKEGKDDQAFVWFSQARRQDGNDPATLWALGNYWLRHGNPVEGKALLGQASAKWQTLDPTLTTDILGQEAAWAGHQWSFLAENQPKWFSTAFSRPAPPFLGLHLPMQAGALCYSTEWDPWIYMPKMRAIAIDGSLLAPTS